MSDQIDEVIRLSVERHMTASIEQHTAAMLSKEEMLVAVRAVKDEILAQVESRLKDGNQRLLAEIKSLLNTQAPDLKAGVFSRVEQRLTERDTHLLDEVKTLLMAQSPPEVKVTVDMADLADRLGDILKMTRHDTGMKAAPVGKKFTFVRDKDGNITHAEVNG